ncbi:MAG TPA: thioredoxin family protein [Verrucomicrobiae bacterium]|nr:thioredoxin family protein [Verrucomicrobiae bacterium]
MKTPVKILIVAALAAAVIAAVALNKSKTANKTQNPAPVAATSAVAADPPQTNAVATVKLPKLLDLGAGKCIPCKMMAPILDELKKEYAGKLNLEFIDVWVNPDAAKPYGIEVIPTQIFYDADGKELFRHVGFFAKEDILAKWKELGVDLASKSNTGK